MPTLQNGEYTERLLAYLHSPLRPASWLKQLAPAARIHADTLDIFETTHIGDQDFKAGMKELTGAQQNLHWSAWGTSFVRSADTLSVCPVYAPRASAMSRIRQ